MTGSTSSVCKVTVTGPLVPFADAYQQELKGRGYAPSTIGVKLGQLARLSCWLEVRCLTAGSLTRVVVDQFVAEQRALGDVAFGRRPGLSALVDVLRGLGVLEHEPEPPGSRAEEPLASFERYLLSERGLAVRTVEAYVAYAGRFLEGLGGDGVVAGLTAGEVTQAVLRESERVSVSSAQYFVAALRSFLRFCLIGGLLQSDLSPAALTVGGRRGSLLPKRIGRADAKALLWSCDRREAVGRRDYAVIVMLLRLGLRASEVAVLRLDEIDWRAGKIVVSARAGARTRFPCRPRWVRRSSRISSAAGRRPIAARCSCAPGRRSGRSKRAGSRRSCAGRAGEPGSGRWGRIAFATRRRARWSRAASRLDRSARCYATAGRPAPRSMPVSISSASGNWHSRGRCRRTGDEPPATARR